MDVSLKQTAVAADNLFSSSFSSDLSLDIIIDQVDSASDYVPLSLSDMLQDNTNDDLSDIISLQGTTLTVDLIHTDQEAACRQVRQEGTGDESQMSKHQCTTGGQTVLSHALGTPPAQQLITTMVQSGAVVHTSLQPIVIVSAPLNATAHNTISILAPT